MEHKTLYFGDVHFHSPRKLGIWGYVYVREERFLKSSITSAALTELHIGVAILDTT